MSYKLQFQPGINVGLFWQHVLELCIIIVYFLVQKGYTQQIIF